MKSLLGRHFPDPIIHKHHSAVIHTFQVHSGKVVVCMWSPRSQNCLTQTPVHHSLHNWNYAHNLPQHYWWLPPKPHPTVVTTPTVHLPQHLSIFPTHPFCTSKKNINMLKLLINLAKLGQVQPQLVQCHLLWHSILESTCWPPWSCASVTNYFLFTLCRFLPYMHSLTNVANIDGLTINSCHVWHFFKRSVLLMDNPSIYWYFYINFVKCIDGLSIIWYMYGCVNGLPNGS